MIGNDIVDLNLASRQSNWRRKGFLEKVFSVDEQQTILSAVNQDQMLWLLWSMKEAAYKAHQRNFSLPRKLNWLDYNCCIFSSSCNNASGAVKVAKSNYLTSSEITEFFIHTSAGVRELSEVKIVVFEKSSEEMKQLLFEQLSQDQKLSKLHFEIQKNEQGVPVIIYQNQLFSNLVSFSDHGRFSAYSLSLMNCEMAVKHY